MTLQDALSSVLDWLKTEGTVLFLEGNLGAGKTHFVNQLAQEMGIHRKLPSPTFTFLQEYPCEWEGKRKLVHCDFYRIEPENAEKMIEQIGFWDYVDEQTIVCIEWPERAASVVEQLPHKTLHITLSPDGIRDYEFS